MRAQLGLGLEALGEVESLSPMIILLLVVVAGVEASVHEKRAPLMLILESAPVAHDDSGSVSVWVCCRCSGTVVEEKD